MGKNLKGKECGKGIYPRKDGLYYARFVAKTGKRHEKSFQTIPEARNWIEQAKYADRHEDVFVPLDTHGFHFGSRALWAIWHRIPCEIIGSDISRISSPSSAKCSFPM